MYGAPSLESSFFADVAEEPFREAFESLSLFDKQQEASGGLLLDWPYRNLRTISPNLKVLLDTAPRIHEAIEGEHFQASSAKEFLSGFTSMDPDKFRGAFGDLLDWTLFIQKLSGSGIVAECRRKVTEGMDGKATDMKNYAISILGFRGLKEYSKEDVERLAAVDASACLVGVAGLQSFAALVSDQMLASQARAIEHLVSLQRETAAVLKWYRGCDSMDARGMGEASVAAMSRLRRMVSHAAGFVPGLADLFGPRETTDAMHCLLLLDDIDPTSIGAFVKECDGVCNMVLKEWTETVVQLSAKTSAYCPEWSDATVMNENIVKGLMSNPNYNILGQLANKLHTIIGHVRTLEKDGCGDMMAAKQFEYASKMREHGIATVSITYAVYQTQNIAKEELSLRSASIDKLKKAVIDKGVAVPSAMEAYFAALLKPPAPADLA